VVLARYSQHIYRNKIQEKYQSAYTEFHSTETALLKVQNDILHAIDSDHTVVLVMLDLSAAFDTIDHNILIERLEKTLGIQGKALNWIKSYLSNRTQRVQIKGIQSEAKPLEFGVPQGSVMGPRMFLGYTQPLGAIARKHGLHLHVYADDTQLYLEFRKEDTEVTIEKIQKCVEDIQSWMTANWLKLNEDKTEIIIFGTKYKLSQLENIEELNICGSVIKPSSQVRNLGVIFDLESIFITIGQRGKPLSNAPSRLYKQIITNKYIE
jgi:hypothetical protein